MTLATLMGCGSGGGALPQQIVVAGRVTASGAAISGAIITSGDATATTQSDGTYSLSIASPSSRVPILVSGAGMAPNIAVVFPKSGVFHYSRDIATSQLTSANVSAAAGGKVSVISQGRPVTISVPPGTGDGGTLVLTAAGYDAANGPGALDTTGAPGANKLQTQGMVYFAVTDGNGNAVSLAPGRGAQIQLQNTNLPDIPNADAMNQWQLNEQGQWDAPTQTMTSATGMNLTAQQQGYWNADRAYKTACVIGHAQAPSMSCGGTQTTAHGLDGISTTDTTGADGTFCLEGPQTVSTQITVGSTNTSVTMPAAPGNCDTARDACADIGTVMVSNADCPSGCPAGQIDTPSGCQTAQSGGACGAPAGGCGSETSVRLRPGCCTVQQCSQTQTLGSCADSCGYGWYEVGETLFGPCLATDASYQTCLNNAATAAINACN